MGFGVTRQNPERQSLILGLHSKGLNGEQIANVVGVSRVTVCNYLRANGFGGKQYGYITEITPWQEAVLIGTLMGDGCLKRAKAHHNAQLKLGHCPAQLDYMKWKAEQLDGFYTESVEPSKYITKEGYETWEIASRSHPILTGFYETFYPGGKKTMSPEILSKIENHDFFPAIMAVWYMDDGSTTQGYPRYVIGNYDDAQCQMFDEWFHHLGFRGTMHKASGNCKTFNIKKTDGVGFFKMIKPYVHASMAYKIPPSIAD